MAGPLPRTLAAPPPSSSTRSRAWTSAGDTGVAARFNQLSIQPDSQHNAAYRVLVITPLSLLVVSATARYSNTMLGQLWVTLTGRSYAPSDSVSREAGIQAEPPRLCQCGAPQSSSSYGSSSAASVPSSSQNSVSDSVPLFPHGPVHTILESAAAISRSTEIEADAQLKADIVTETSRRGSVKAKSRQDREQSPDIVEPSIISEQDNNAVLPWLSPAHAYVSYAGESSTTPAFNPRHNGQRLYANIPALPSIPRGRERGVAFFHKWLIPSEDMDKVMLVSHRDDVDGMKEHLFRITKKGTKAIEVVVSGDRKGEYAYIGTFMPMSRWLPFKKEVTGDIPELFERCVNIPDSHHTNVLRAEWVDGLTHDYAFCVFTMTGFNNAFLSSVFYEPSRKRKRR